MGRKPSAPCLTPGVAIAVQYCRDVLARRIAACRLVHLTCERFLRDLATAHAGQEPWEFRSELAERAMTFAGLLPNIRGPEAGQPLRLMPWQRLVFGAVATFRDTTGPFRVPRYDLYPAAEVQLNLNHGFSTGQGIAAIEKIAHERLPQGFRFEWMEIALQEKLAGNTAALAFALAVVFVFLLLAALYESWLLPLAVVLPGPPRNPQERGRPRA
jgi:hypothetical protein